VTLSLSPRKAEKPASPTVTISPRAEIPACRSLIYSCKNEISAWKFRKKLSQIMPGSSGYGGHMLWELRGERVKVIFQLMVWSAFLMTRGEKFLTAGGKPFFYGS